jgi:PAS domain S-box-containing protein
MTASRQEGSERAHGKGKGNGQLPGTQVQDRLEEAELKPLSAQAQQLVANALPESGHLLPAILANSPAVIYVKDLQGRYLLGNRRYETLFQVTQEQIAGRTDYDLFPAASADAFRANDLRVLAAATPLEFEEVVPHADGTHTYIALKFPIAGPTGVPYAVCGIATDITARQQGQRRLLAEHAVTRALAQSFALGDAVPMILQAVCESLGWDVGIYWDLDRNADVLRCVEVWHAATVEVAAFERLCRRMTFARGVGLPGRFWASGQPGWIADVGEDANCPRSAAALEEGLHGACGFPVRNGGEPLGVMEFFSQAIREPDANVLDMMASISSQVAQFAERRQAEKTLHERERELSLARAIQQRRLPKAAPALAGFDIGAASHPAKETGGDYLDFIPLPDGSLGIAVGDASGHGIGAALLMAETRAYVRALARTDTDIGRVLSLVNRHVGEDIGDDFVTLVFARLDPRTRSLVYSSAGHWPGYVLDGRGEVKRALDSTGLPLGLDPTATFPDGAALTLAPGDLVLLLTDGIVEAISPAGPQFGMARALECVRVHRGATSGEIVAALFDEVRAFSHDLQIDDMTVVVIKVRQA